MTTGRGVGAGKIILCGEHAVVYGHPAIAFAVDRTTRVTLTAHPGPTQVTGPDVDSRVTRALCTVIEHTGWRVEVDSDVWVGRGMGSSAALAVALMRARADLQGRTPDADALVSEAMPIERAFHGNPSGLDVVVSTHGGCIEYRRGPPTVWTSLRPGPWSVVLLDSGTVGCTADMVALVGGQRPEIDGALDDIGALVHEAVHVLDTPSSLGPLLTRNHRLLQRLGVSTPALDDLVSLALAHGAHGAKLAGAGGGGIVIALTDDPQALLTAAQARGIRADSCAPWSLP